MKQSTLSFSKSETAGPSATRQKRVINLDSDSDDELEELLPDKKRKLSSEDMLKGNNDIKREVDCANDLKRASPEPGPSRLPARRAAEALSIPPIPFNIKDVLYPVDPRIIRKDADGLDLLYFSGFVSGPKRGEFFDYLRAALPFYRVRYTVRGININTPRYTTVFGCDQTGAKSSAYKIQPRAIPPVLQDLKDWVQQCTAPHTYNFVLVNYYATGNDSISWHSDDEKFLGDTPCIASLSLGGSRDFGLKHKTNKGLPQEKFHLASGDMVVM